VIEGDGTAIEAHQGKSESRECEWKFESSVARQSVVKVHFGDGDAHIHAKRESGNAGKQADKDEDSAEKFGESGDVSTPGRKAQAGNELNVMMKAAKNFVISVDEKNDSERQAHNQERERLQSIEVAQEILRRERK
jgi:hypothetical protein